MEIRQLRYFTSAVRSRSLGKAAREMGLTPAALSQQISRLEAELSVQLLQRTNSGVTPTPSGLAFLRQAELALRYLDAAERSAKLAQFSGVVSIGLAPTTASVISLPLIHAMRERYPNIRIHLVELLSGHLSALLNSRQIDIAILFNDIVASKWSVTPLLDESLYLMATRGFKSFPDSPRVTLADIGGLALAMPSRMHGLRNVLASAAERELLTLNVIMEVDSLAVLMDIVGTGLAGTIQPYLALRHISDDTMLVAEISDSWFVRHNLLVSLSDDELSPAAVAVRDVVYDVARELVLQKTWSGATLCKP